MKKTIKKFLLFLKQIKITIIKIEIETKMASTSNEIIKEKISSNEREYSEWL